MYKSLFILCFMSFYGFGQHQINNDTLIRKASINHLKEGNSILFTPETPPLNQIAGAPKAFYSYFWEFGDGHYSKEKAPQYTYKKKGEYKVRMWATNNYDTGKPPQTRPKKVVVNTVTNDYKDEASLSTDFNLIRNREPVPEEELVVVMSYKNSKNYMTNGQLYLFYNEHKFKANNFDLLETRTYHKEKTIAIETFAFNKPIDDGVKYLASLETELTDKRISIQDSIEKTNLPLTLEESKAYFKNWKLLEFDSLKPQEQRHVFFSLKTTPEMIKDTSAIITVRGVYVPDSNYSNHKIKDMEMEIVTSHDPNKMSSNGTFMNYRLVRFKTLKYKIKFQNNGEGPARTIRLETDIPEMLDKTTLKVVDMYPKCKICPKKRVSYSCLDTTFTNTQAIFTFKNIYLPGSEQKNVKEHDSTKGFVKYKIKFAKDFHKKKTKSRTAIIFDKNEPIITNYSTTRFLPGISIGAKSGYNYFPDLINSTSYFVGATISPYKSYRWYLQAELMNNFHNYNAETKVVNQMIDDIQGTKSKKRITTETSYQNIEWDIPVLARYNINNYIGLGAGLQNTISVSTKNNEQITTEEFEGIEDNAPVTKTTKEFNESSSSFSNLRTGLLVEATAGFSRIGPSLGARYVFNFENEFNYWQLYAIWKF